MWTEHNKARQRRCFMRISVKCQSWPSRGSPGSYRTVWPDLLHGGAPHQRNRNSFGSQSSPGEDYAADRSRGSYPGLSRPVTRIHFRRVRNRERAVVALWIQFERVDELSYGRRSSVGSSDLCKLGSCPPCSISRSGSSVANRIDMLP